jgi:LPS-assembly protein
MSEAVGLPGAAPDSRKTARRRALHMAGACAVTMSVASAPLNSQSQTNPTSAAQTPSQTPTQTRAPEAPSRTFRLKPEIGPPHVPDRAAHGPIGEDGLSADELYIEADTVTRDDEHDLLIARGHVQARYKDRTLRSDELTYDTETGQVTAAGHAQIISADGTVEYADHVDMDDKLHAGAAEGFAARQAQNAKVAAASAIRRNEDVTELNRAIYTPCAVCTPKGKPTSPTWSISADKAVQDKTRRIILYRNATIRVKGVPIFWSPILWTPDPTSPRQSGLLAPRILRTERLGLSWQQPYLWVISPSQDVEIKPQINTNVNPLLEADYRKRFYSGSVEIRGAVTYERNFNNDGDKFGDETARSFILANGAFDIDNAWRWGFSAEHASDPTLFDRYDITNIYLQRGLFGDDTRRLTSQIFAVRQDSDSYLSLSAVNFQSLRIYTEYSGTGANAVPVIDPVTKQPVQSAENQSGLPTVAPLLEGRWSPDVDIWGGRLRVFGSAVLLDRDQATLNPYGRTTSSDPCYGLTTCNGVSDQRGTLSAEWRSSFTTPNGIRFQPFLNLRGDIYNVQAGIGPIATNLGLTNPSSPTSAPVYYPNATLTRGTADLGVDISYPLYRSLGAVDLILEPMAELVLSPKATLDPRIPNEDSQAIQLDETTLFRPDRFPGYDLYEGGPRASVGAMATLDWGQGHSAHLFLGRAFRSENDLAFPAGSGLRESASDWIVSGMVSPVKGLSGWTREQFDGQNGSLRRSETAFNWKVDWTHGIFRYLVDDTGLLDLIDPSFTYPVTPQGQVQEAEAAGYVLFTHHWGVVFDATRDVRENIWRRAEAGILYQDDCIRTEVVYQRNETNPLGPTSTVLLRLSFAIAGDGNFKDSYDDR